MMKNTQSSNSKHIQQTSYNSNNQCTCNNQVKSMVRGKMTFQMHAVFDIINQNANISATKYDRN